MINDLEEVQWAYLLDPTFELVNSSGKPITGGWLEVYIHGTRTKYYCASDFDGTLHPFKIPLDSLGANIVLASPAHAYDVYAYNIYGNLVMSRYNVVPATGDGTVIKDVVNITSSDGTVNVQSSDQTNWDLSIKDTVDTVELLNDTVATAVSSINDRIDNIESDLTNKKDKQSALNFNGGATKTVKKITQNANGVVNVEFEEIDLPPEVPNVEITSPNGTIDVQSSTDVETNTKTFEIDVKQGNVNWINARSAGTDMGIGTGITITGFIKKDGNIDIVPQYNLLPLKNEAPYLVIEELTLKTVEPGVNKCSDVQVHLFNEGISGDHAGDIVAYARLDNSNAYTQTITVGGILYGGKTGRSHDDYGGGIYASVMNKFTGSVIESTITATVNNISVYELSSIMTQGGGSGYNTVVTSSDNSVEITETTVGDTTTYDLSVDAASGTEYTAGDAIDLTDNEISVKVNPSSGIDIVDDKLVVKVGEGLAIDPVSGVVIINSEVGDVVATVEKLKKDLDTQLTVNFDMPNVDNVYDFADPSVIGMSNGAVMLCQAFTVPINHDIRVDDGVTENPTLVGIYAKQAFTGKKIMLALYVYDFDTGYTDYVGDTGPVSVVQGRNEFPLVHINPNISELKSSCVYYASLYLPSNAHSNGLFLAGCPSYSNASYINAIPRFTVGVENITYNNTEIDMTDATTGRLDYNDGNGNYYIGPWSDNYNERPAIPRFFMQIRNGEADTPIIVEPFTDIGTFTLKNTSSVNNVFGSTITVNTSTYGAMFMEVTPAQDVDITGWVCYDNYATDDRYWYGMVFDSSFENQLSTSSAGTLTNLGEISTGVYGHEFTRTSPLHLTGGTTYRFLVGIPHSNNDMLVQYNTPSVPKTLHLFESGYNVSQWVTYSRANNVQGIDFLIKDANNEWRI